MTTLRKIRRDDTDARDAVLKTLRADDPRFPDDVFDQVLREHPHLSYDSIRRAAWGLINDHKLALTSDFRLTRR